MLRVACARKHRSFGAAQQVQFPRPNALHPFAKLFHAHMEQRSHGIDTGVMARIAKGLKSKNAFVERGVPRGHFDEHIRTIKLSPKVESPTEQSTQQFKRPHGGQCRKSHDFTESAATRAKSSHLVRVKMFSHQAARAIDTESQRSQCRTI